MDSDVKIDLADNSDLDAVVELLSQQLAEHGVIAVISELREAVTAVMRNKDLGFVLTARQETLLLGCAYVSFVWSMEHAGKTAWLEEMFVIPEHRNKGVGKALLIEALARSTAAQCRAMDLEIDDSHSRAARLYERQGFVRLGRTRWVQKLARNGN